MITIEAKIIDGIPLNEYINDQLESKGLVFMQHGFESNKVRGGEYMAGNLCRLGYHVVCIDAYKHGDRIEEPFITGSEFDRVKEAYQVVEHTAKDIIKLFETGYHSYDTFDMIGVSLGGMIGYYLATITDKINRLIPVISTPNFSQQAYLANSASGREFTEMFTREEIEEMTKIDPNNHVDKMVFNELAIFISENDNIVPSKPVFDFVKQYENRVNLYKIYDVKHNVPRAMQEDILSYITGKRINL